MKILLTLFISSLLFSCQKNNYYIKRTVTATVKNDSEEKEVYRAVEIKELESNKIIEKKEIEY